MFLTVKYTIQIMLHPLMCFSFSTDAATTTTFTTTAAVAATAISSVPDVVRSNMY